VDRGAGYFERSPSPTLKRSVPPFTRKPSIFCRRISISALSVNSTTPQLYSSSVYRRACDTDLINFPQKSFSSPLVISFGRYFTVAKNFLEEDLCDRDRDREPRERLRLLRRDLERRERERRRDCIQRLNSTASVSNDKSIN